MTENEDNSHRIVNNKSVEEFKSNDKISIEDIDYFSKKVKITSPRSIKAMNNLGINNQDLEFLTFKEYLEKNPRLIAESKRIQKLEYNHIQAIRKDLINQVIEARKMIISEGNHNKKRSVSSRYRKSIAIDNNINLHHSKDLTEKDLKAINRMKNINKTTLSNRLELELKKELKSLINNEIEQKANEKKLMFSQKVERKRKIDNLKKMTEEAEKERMAKLLDKQQKVLMVDAVDEDGNIKAGLMAHQSNDGVSSTYNVITGNMAVRVLKSQLDNTIKMYLQDVRDSLGRKVLYRGLYPNE